LRLVGAMSVGCFDEISTRDEHAQGTEETKDQNQDQHQAMKALHGGSLKAH